MFDITQFRMAGYIFFKDFWKNNLCRQLLRNSIVRSKINLEASEQKSESRILNYLRM